MPPRTTYVEPFAGSAAVFFEKEPAPVEALNDADPEIAFAAALAFGCGSSNESTNTNADNKHDATPAKPADPPALPTAARAPKPGDVPAPPDVAAPPGDAAKTASGLAYRLLSAGKGGPRPTPRDRVTVHYSSWTTDGNMFDSSVTRGAPISLGLNQVIKGWTEGLQLMQVGDKMRFWIPADLADGEKPSRPGAPAGMLVFDVELLGISGTALPGPDGGE